MAKKSRQQPRRNTKYWVHDTPELYEQKLDLAYKYCALRVGSEDYIVMVEWLRLGYIEVARHLLEYEGVTERLGMIFGSKYADDRDRIAIAFELLEAHERYLSNNANRKRHAKQKSEMRRIHDRKPAYKHRGPQRRKRHAA